MLYIRESNMTEKISIKPVIKDNKINSIEVQDVLLPLKEELSLDELQQLVEAVEVFFKYVDVDRLRESLEEEEEGLSEWIEKDLRKFVLTQLRDSQAVALKVLTQCHEITREEFIEKMRTLLGDSKFRGWSLGGLLAGITMKSKTWGYESPYDSEWRMVGNKWKCFYFLTSEKYRDIISRALKEREEGKERD